MSKRATLRESKRSIQDIVESNWSFDIDQADAIIGEVGLPFCLTDNEIPEHIAEAQPNRLNAATLAWNLNNAANALRWDERRQSMPKPADVSVSARRIEKLCTQLVAELRGGGDVVRDGLGSGALYAFAARENESGAEAVERVIAGVVDLQRWASGLAMRAGARASATPGKRTKDEAWHALIERLSGVYFFLWKRRPGLSKDPCSGAPGGPYFRFVSAVVDHLLPGQRTDDAIATAIARHRWGKGANFSLHGD
jgi:hypothetical protein